MAGWIPKPMISKEFDATLDEYFQAVQIQRSIEEIRALLQKLSQLQQEARPELWSRKQ